MLFPKVIISLELIPFGIIQDYKLHTLSKLCYNHGINFRGAYERRLRGSHLTSTLIPDTDNAVVGRCYRRHKLLQRYRIRCLCFLCCLSLQTNWRGSARQLSLQRWEAVFRRERRPVSLDRNRCL